jgi:hypothetical protein
VEPVRVWLYPFYGHVVKLNITLVFETKIAGLSPAVPTIFNLKTFYLASLIV